MSLFSIRMRASAQADGAHLCGAECIADAAALTERCQSLVERALMHERGKAGKITLTVEPLNKAEIIHLNALPVTTRRLPSVEAAWEQAIELLQSLGIARAREAAVFFSTAYNMRGAMLVDADTLERLESDKSRGIRVTRMDAAPILQAKPAKTAFKNHFREALVLATKAANAPGIIAELCVSDDPNYQTGYIASKKIGYVRLTPLKERGDTRGGRILFFRQAPEADDCISACIDYLQRQPVLVCGIPDNPPAPDAGHKWQAIQAGNFGITEQECFEIYKKIGIIANKHTGEKAVFVKSAFNKIIHHKGFDKRIIAVLDQLFINAWKMYDEPVNTAHKIHTNFSKYSHYAAKVLLDEKEVYTRITLQTLKTKPWKQEINEFHSVHLSYEVKSDARRPRVNSSIISLATWGVEGTTDVKLQNWLNSVNPFINDNIHSQPPDAGHKWQALKDALA
ncbi:MAG: 6-carboxyhexanoate--CoA ligase, partial [Spirochaetaceae bacterium]|nr:6-carboxyhexanoate--CoA ligase [Spirochaetaceae bacterium]